MAFTKSRDCRKPRSVMIYSILGAWPLVAPGSVLFGDRKGDSEVAEPARQHGVLASGGCLWPVVKAMLSEHQDPFLAQPPSMPWALETE